MLMGNQKNYEHVCYIRKRKYDDIVKELTSLESLQLVTDLLILPNLVFANY